MARKPTGKDRPPSTIGPVADLESHLPAEWWRELFDSLYLKTDGDVVENDVNTTREVDFLIKATGLTPADHILDLCCGQGRHAIELATRGYQHVTGIDRSRFLIRTARRRARRAGLKVAFHEGDARKVRVAENSFDCIYLMGNSFGYFDREEDDRRVLEAVKRALHSGGTLALDITDGEWMRTHFDARTWEWIDQNHFVCRERSLTADGERLVSRELISHAERGVLADQFYAERLYSQEKLAKLLGDAGFLKVRFHGWLQAESARGQDLGMMAHRLFVTAEAPRKAVVQTGRRRPPMRVTVLMGDPRMPDMVKRSGKFNPEDFEVIEQLKHALAELPGYTFQYLDNHASLFSDLRKLETDLVFNLCDEGFNNDAFKELHVPAFLEMLDISYTGAGPACLAMCYDKALVLAIAGALDVPVPLETFVNPDDQGATLPSIFPAILKPNFGDSSLGITKDAIVDTPQKLIAYLNRLRELVPGRPVLVQEFLSGAEYSVALVGNPGTGIRALPILEVDYGGLDPALPRILGYESKWLPDSPYWNDIRYRETAADGDTQRNLVEWSTRLFERLACRDYARFDFRCDAEGNPKLLEVNPNPGWVSDGKLNL
ncbi:MAG: methyltransferase domain-containing protein, partial [Alphaproteobacteria bacterium]|nr:methyltransferase domain-containing protein [Alphaproteobacteria bacterium]